MTAPDAPDAAERCPWCGWDRHDEPPLSEAAPAIACALARETVRVVLDLDALPAQPDDRLRASVAALAAWHLQPVREQAARRVEHLVERIAEDGAASLLARDCPCGCTLTLTSVSGVEPRYAFRITADVCRCLDHEHGRPGP